MPGGVTEFLAGVMSRGCAIPGHHQTFMNWLTTRHNHHQRIRVFQLTQTQGRTLCVTLNRLILRLGFLWGIVYLLPQKDAQRFTNPTLADIAKFVDILVDGAVEAIREFNVSATGLALSNPTWRCLLPVHVAIHLNDATHFVERR